MAVDMFLKLDGVNGESKDKTHKLDIDVLAWSWGMSNSGSAHQGGGAGSGKVNVQDVVSRMEKGQVFSVRLVEVSALVEDLGFRSRVCRSTLADANEVRDWRIYADLAALLTKGQDGSILARKWM